MGRSEEENIWAKSFKIVKRVKERAMDQKQEMKVGLSEKWGGSI